MIFYFTNMICLLEKSDTIDKQIRVHFQNRLKQFNLQLVHLRWFRETRSFAVIITDM